MTDYVTLLGAENVSRAAATIQAAAEQMNHAASSMDSTLYQQRLWMDDWLLRFEAAVEKLANAAPSEPAK